MKRIFATLAIVTLLVSSFAMTSCRENKTTTIEVDDSDDLEDAIDDAGDAIEEGVDEIEENTGTGGTDDN